VTAAAPADDYFGSTKISAIGIRNTVNALARRYHERSIADDDLVHDAKLAEAAAYDWQRHYPRDPWIPSTLFRLDVLFGGVQSTNARSHAMSLATFLAKAYPATKEAHLIRLRLAQGFPPLHAEIAPHATPNPYASEAAPAGSPTPSPSSVPQPAASALPSPSPANSAFPRAAPSPTAT
jgi:hypothetical protein